MWSLSYPSRSKFWIGWLHWFTYRIWVFHSSREMVSWLWAIKHHYLLTTCSGNTCVAVNSSCCLERDNTFSSINQSRKEWQVYNPLIQVLHHLISSGDSHRKGLEGDHRKLTFIHHHLLVNYCTSIPYNNPEVNVTAPFYRGRSGDSGRWVNKPNSLECDSTFSALQYITTNSLRITIKPRLCVALESDSSSSSSNSNSSFYEIAMYRAVYKIWLSY